MKTSAFIVFDGVDGAGKSTQASLLASYLRAKGISVHETCEPSTLPVGALIRSYVRLERTDRPPPAAAMALLFAADRLQHLADEIEPKLATQHIVICDRYIASSIAYQGASSSTSAAEIEAASQWIAGLNRFARTPDCTLLFDIDPELAAERRKARLGKEELFETLELQKRIRSQYDKMATYRPHDCMHRICAERDIDAVHQEVVAIVEAALRE